MNLRFGQTVEAGQNDGKLDSFAAGRNFIQFVKRQLAFAQRPPGALRRCVVHPQAFLLYKALEVVKRHAPRRMAGGIHRSLVTVGTRALRIGFDHRRSLLARSKETVPLFRASLRIVNG